MAYMSLNKVGKNYGSVNVLRNIDLDFNEGEFVVLIGPSGCGKSTLLRMIAGLEGTTNGTISISGKVMNDLEARERDIAMVFQSYALYPHMTVAQNIGFPLRVRGESAEDMQEAVTRVAEMIGLTDFLDRKPAELSGGQRQRVAMGRAIVRSPKVFLFDEPLSNLDAKLRVEMRLQIRELHRRVGATSVYVTHDQVEAMTLADRVVLLNDGDVQQIGTPMELYDRPANTFVASFIGSPEMNLIDAIIGVDDGPIADLGDGNIVSLPREIVGNLTAGQKVVLGIRPEHLDLSSNGLKAVFRDAEQLGAESHIFAQVGKTLMTGVLPGAFSASPGAVLHLAPQIERLHIFDALTSERLGP